MSLDIETTFYCKANQFDVITVIDSKLEASPIQCKWRHIKDHQDDHIGTLDRWATLNVECDQPEKKRCLTDQETRPGHNTTHNLEDE